LAFESEREGQDLIKEQATRGLLIESAPTLKIYFSVKYLPSRAQPDPAAGTRQPFSTASDHPEDLRAKIFRLYIAAGITYDAIMVAISDYCRRRDRSWNYPGAKNGAGVFQSIINLMPPHELYIEAFLGSGAVMRHKRPAAQSIGIEIDREVCDAWRRQPLPYMKLIEGDALEFLRADAWPQQERALVYADPPYLFSTRKSSRPIYRHELATEDQHAALLDVLKRLPCMVMISGYESELYDRALGHWRRSEISTTNRAGPTTEIVWMNFPDPWELHDYQYLGRNKTERQVFKRQRDRWRSRLLNMDSKKRAALLAAVSELRSDIAQPETAALAIAAGQPEVTAGDRDVYGSQK
jgi:DNA adenine methylase